MAGANEHTVQDAITERLSQPDLGWTYVPGKQLNRQPEQVIVEPDLVAALIRLNPLIAEQPDRVDEILPRLRALLLSVRDDGLTRTNAALSLWLRGLETHRFTDTDDHVDIKLIDFDRLNCNTLVVSDEVTYVGADTRRYDIVLWVNGIPLVVGECKTPVERSSSWLDAASDIVNVYERKTPAFFVPNVLSFATDGRDLRYGAIEQPPEQWLAWGATTDPLPKPGIRSVLRAAELLLSAETLLSVLRDFTFYTTSSSSGATVARKVVPRYPQVEAVDAIVQRVKDPVRRTGLIWHHQGSGKTLAMAFAAGKLTRDPTLDAPTIVVVLDRLDLYDQLTAEFRSAGVTGLRRAETGEQLRAFLSGDSRGVVVTTVFRFRDAGLLNERRNIVVMVDEAHRTQEGRVGEHMRAALPNANFIGLTGTPVSEGDRNTWDRFGHPDDPDRVLNRYTPERSIADGATLPVHVETRLVDFNIRQEDLDRAYAEMIATESLTDEEAELLSRKAGTVGVLMGTPQRVFAIAQDVVLHYRERMAPLGLKAQVVVYDRTLCIAFYEALTSLLAEGEEATVVMTVDSGKDGDPETWKQFARDRASENAVKERFRNAADPLCFLIVTSKLVTGFDAPIEGVMYLDKPMRAHNLFQAVARTNRRYTNPATGQEKQYGLVVDYVGLGTEIAKALAVQDPGGRRRPHDVETLYSELAEAVADALARFHGIDRTDSGFATLAEAQDRLDGKQTLDSFAVQFLRAQALFEFLWPASALRPYEADYRWLAKVYASVQPATPSNTLLWHRLGAKTRELVAAAVDDVTVRKVGPDHVAVDVETMQAIVQLGLTFGGDGDDLPLTAEDVLDTIERRLAARMTGERPHPVYESLARRLDDLRQTKLREADESVEFLQRILHLARDVVTVERSEAEGNIDDMTSLLPDPHVGALTQILREYAPATTPAIIERVVVDIDAIVRQVRFIGWQESAPGDRDVRRELRSVLRSKGLPVTGDLFDHAYAYVRANY